MSLLEQAEGDLQEIFERHQVDPVKMKGDVEQKKGYLEKLKAATEEMINRLKELSNALSSMTNRKPVIDGEVS